MNARIRYTVLLLLGLVAESAHAQHLDVLVQAVDGKLVTGAANYDDNTWLLGQRVFKRQLQSNFRTNDPGFASLATGNPLLGSGAMGLPGGTDLMYDIIPTTIDGQSANYWYWDGIDADENGFELEDVSFGLGAPGLEWRVLDDDSTAHIADGSDTVVPNVLVQETFSNGTVHEHILMFLVDNDGNGELNRPEGVYLTTMVLRAEGFEDSEPFMFVHRTAGLTDEPRDIAAEWVIQNYDLLIGTGDYDDDGDVDGSDFLVWQRDLGTAEDLADWQNNYGNGASSALGAVTSVPEPSTLVSAIFVCAAFSVRRRRV